MDYEKKLLWIIPNNEYNDRNLEDGKPIFYPFILGDRDHRIRTVDFCNQYGFTNYPEAGSHNDWGKYFTELGFSVVFNSAVTVDSKYFCSIFLPKQLTNNQIEFFESQKEMFYEKYHSNPGFFEAVVLPEGNLEYRSSNGFRDLKIEAIINGKPNNNGIDLFYDEINSQKEKLSRFGK